MTPRNPRDDSEIEERKPRSTRRWEDPERKRKRADETEGGGPARERARKPRTRRADDWDDDDWEDDGDLLADDDLGEDDDLEELEEIEEIEDVEPVEDDAEDRR